MKKLLAIEKTPLIRTYLHYAFPFSVLMTNSYYNDWILNNFIQMIYDPQNACPYDYHEYLYNNWPCIDNRKLTKEEIEMLNIDIIDLIINEINNNFYTVLWGDFYFIPNTALYNTKHDSHGLLIYGYDTDKKSFLAMLYNFENKYITSEISYNDLSSMFYSNQVFSYVDIMKTNSYVSVDYDFYRIQYKLKCYLSSKDYDVDDNKYHQKAYIEAYGVNACKSIINYLENLSNKEIDLRWPYLFAEHKRCMMFRIKMILEEYNIPEYKFTQNDFNILSNESKIVLSLCMKYNYLKKQELIKKTCKQINKIMEHEREMLLPIIEYDRKLSTVRIGSDGKPIYKPINSL